MGSCAAHPMQPRSVRISVPAHCCNKAHSGQQHHATPNGQAVLSPCPAADMTSSISGRRTHPVCDVGTADLLLPREQ